jgi:ABC-2 type transport system permease protein
MSPAFAKYARVFSVGLQNTFVYRWNFVLRSIFGIVPLIGTIYLWRAMYGGDPGKQLGGYTMGALIMYFAVVVFVENLITPTDDEWQIAGDIRDGRLSSLLLKPLNYLAYRFTLYASYRLLYSAIILPGVLLIFFFLRSYIVLPTDPWTYLAFGVSLVFAALIQFFIAYTLAMIAFWLLEISTIVFIMMSFEYFLSGQMFPLEMLPAWMGGFIKWSPFSYELYFPVQIFMGRIHGAEMYERMAIQAGWAVVMYLLSQALWKAGLRKYQAFGG